MPNSPLVTVAQIGVGYWGPNLLRNLVSNHRCVVKVVADLSEQRCEFVENLYPAVRTTRDYESLLSDSSIDAVVIATPPATHFEIVMKALNAGKHVMVEKPMAKSVEEVEQIATLALERDLVAMVGDTFLYNQAVRYLKQFIDSGAAGVIRYIFSQRVNLGRIRSDVDALWNFAPHDISIVQYLLDNPEPVAVSRKGMDYIQKNIDDVVFLHIEYPGKVMAHIHLSWLDPQKIRRMTVVGSNKMIVYDDLAETKIAIFDKGIEPRAVLGEHMDFDRPDFVKFDYRSGDVMLPKIESVEPLRTEIEHFIDCIENRIPCLTGPDHAKGVVRILSSAKQSSRPHACGTMNVPKIKEAQIVDVDFGENVTVIEPVNLYGCAVGDNSFIGPFVEIQKGVRIGRNCRIQSHSFICELVEIGNDCFVSHGVMFINDRFSGGGPARGDRSLYGKTRIGNRVSIGTNATILPVTIPDGTVIGAGAVVTKDIAIPGVYVGNPARLTREL